MVKFAMINPLSFNISCLVLLLAMYVYKSKAKSEMMMVLQAGQTHRLLLFFLIEKYLSNHNQHYSVRRLRDLKDFVREGNFIVKAIFSLKPLKIKFLQQYSKIMVTSNYCYFSLVGSNLNNLVKFLDHCFLGSKFSSFLRWSQ